MMVVKKQPKVSILVPCYNVEKYLPACLDSICRQTLKDIEIICINDGSKDSTLDIIKRYAKQDNRFVVIDKENEGYGKSMNRGLDVASGEYVGIVESDDWVELDAFEVLYNAAKKNRADMVKADFVFFDNDTGNETPGWSIGIRNDLKEKVFCPTELNPDIIWTGHPSIWTCLYSNKMIQDNNIRFATTPGASFQDMGFKPKTFAVSERFFYIPKVVLHYRKHENNSDKNNGKIFAVSEAHDDTDRWLKENRPDLLKLNKIMNQSRFSNYNWNLHRLYGQPKKEFQKRFSSEYRRYYSNKALERCYFDDKSWLKLLSIIHSYNPLWVILRTFVVVLSPVYRTKICSGYKVYYLFNKIVLKKVPLSGVKRL